MLNTPTGGALGGPGKQWRLGSLPGRFLRRQISVQAYLLVLFVLVSLRMLIAFSQRVLLTPQGAPLDDMLMIRGAMSITEGEWLGAYNAFNTAKNMGYAVILAALHIIRLPVLDAVLDLISESYENISITENNIKSLHNSLMKYSTKDEWHKGDYKQHSNAVEATFV